MTLASAPDAGTAAKRFVWEVPQLIQRAPVEGETRALGVPVRLEAARSKMKAQDLLQFYVTAFEKAGLYIPPRQHQPQITTEVQLNALDVRTLTSYTVILQPNPDGTTTVFLGEAELSQRTPSNSNFPPVMPGATSPLRVQSEGSEVITYSVAAKPEEILGFYRAQLSPVGYSEVEPGRFKSEHAELRVDVRPGGQGQSVLLLLRSTAE